MYFTEAPHWFLVTTELVLLHLDITSSKPRETLTCYETERGTREPNWKPNLNMTASQRYYGSTACFVQEDGKRHQSTALTFTKKSGWACTKSIIPGGGYICYCATDLCNEEMPKNPKDYATTTKINCKVYNSEYNQDGTCETNGLCSMSIVYDLYGVPRSTGVYGCEDYPLNVGEPRCVQPNRIKRCFCNTNMCDPSKMKAENGDNSGQGNQNGKDQGTSTTPATSEGSQFVSISVLISAMALCQIYLAY